MNRSPRVPLSLVAQVLADSPGVDHGLLAGTQVLSHQFRHTCSVSELRSVWADPPPAADVDAEYFGDSTLAAARLCSDWNSVWSRISDLAGRYSSTCPSAELIVFDHGPATYCSTPAVKLGQSERCLSCRVPARPQSDALRAHWGIENRLRWVRDVVFAEDLSQGRTGHGPQVMATLRNLAVSLHRITGAAGIAVATRRLSRYPNRILPLLE